MSNDLNRNACALIACILNPKLSRRQALIRMEIKDLPIESPIERNLSLTLTPDALENIENLYSVKMLNAREIGNIYKVSVYTVTRFLHKNRIQVRGRGLAHKGITA